MDEPRDPPSLPGSAQLRHGAQTCLLGQPRPAPLGDDSWYDGSDPISSLRSQQYRSQIENPASQEDIKVAAKKMTNASLSILFTCELCGSPEASLLASGRLGAMPTLSVIVRVKPNDKTSSRASRCFSTRSTISNLKMANYKEAMFPPPPSFWS